MKHTTIAIIGMGNVGATTAYTLMLNGLASELLLIDIDVRKCEGEARDLADVISFSSTACVTTASLQEARTADIIIICAGKPQKPDQSRRELAQINSAIISSIITELKPDKNSIIIMVTNPVDLMTLIACKTSKLPTHQIMGSGTWLDTQRLKHYLAQRVNIAPESVDTMIIGEHGDAQCVLWSHTQLAHRSLDEWGITPEEAHALAQQTTQEAYAIIQAKCATYYGVASCVADLCKAIIYNEERVIPVSNYNQQKDLCYSMPCSIGERGIHKVITPALSPREQACFDQSLATLAQLKSLFY